MTNEELVYEFQNGPDSRAAIEKLYLQNFGMIHSIARKYRGYAEVDDLMQEAFFGLHTAATKYREEDGAFITYAYYWILSSMELYTLKNGLIKISTKKKQLIRRYQQLVSERAKSGENSLSDEEVAQSIGCSVETAKTIKKIALMVCVASIDTPLSEDEDITLADTLQGCDGIEDDIVDRMQEEEMKRELWQQVDNLSEREAIIIHKMYQEDKTLRELAEQIGVSFTRVRTIERFALRKLKKRLNNRFRNKYMDEYIYTYAIRGNGAGTFNRTWTSSTEKTAIKLTEIENY